MKDLRLRNAQRTRPLKIEHLRRATLALLEDLLRLPSYELAIHFISPKKMAEMNKQYLDHEGSTDVITFAYRDGLESAGTELSGEIFISVADAVAQGLEYKRPWKEELLRYIVHGVLHLRGYDDLTAADRKTMKAVENRLVKQLCPPPARTPRRGIPA